MVLTLRIVSCVVRGRCNVDEVHIELLITRFLLPSPTMSLADAIQFNSLELLDWIWDASCTSVDARRSTWTLTNYLRSDPHYYRWQFAEAMKVAVQYGNFEVVKWLFAHFSWCVVPIAVVESAVSKGNLDILKFLRDNDADARSLDMRYAVATGGHVDVLRWYIERFPAAVQHSAERIITTASMYGQLDLLKELHRLDVLSRLRTCSSRTNLNEKAGIWWPPRCHAMDTAAAHGRLDIVKWLHVHRDEKCSTKAMDVAAANGYLEIVQWFHGNREEGCTTKAMDGAAGNGHVHVAEWLHRNRSEGCTSDAIDQAVQNGHLDAVKWLYKNRLAGGTAKALTDSISRGHVLVASWLHAHFPDLVPVGLDFSAPEVSINFEILLFLHFHFPSELTPQVVYQATKIFSNIYFGTTSDAVVVEWLEENYPNQQTRDRDHG
eukprot:jgi/Phyca11/112308/e_gw1.22.244.1